MNTNNDNPAAKAAGMQTLAVKALLLKLKQHSAFQLDFSERCDRLIAIRAALRDRDALPAETAAELIWRYAEAVIAVAVLPSASKADLAHKVTSVGPISREFLPPVEATLIANAVMSALTADGQFLGVNLTITSNPPPSSGSGSLN